MTIERAKSNLGAVIHKPKMHPGTIEGAEVRTLAIAGMELANAIELLTQRVDELTNEVHRLKLNRR